MIYTIFLVPPNNFYNEYHMHMAIGAALEHSGQGIPYGMKAG